MNQVKTEDSPAYTGESPAQKEERLVLTKAKHILQSRLANGNALTSPEDVATYISIQLHNTVDEHFAVLFLDTQHRLISYEVLFKGTIDGCSIYPRVLCRRALELNAAAIILAHNHPSGNPNPSNADKKITKRIQEACELLDIVVLDHFIVGTEGFTSFAQRGMM